jgi:hypothetical protein
LLNVKQDDSLLLTSLLDVKQDDSSLLTLLLDVKRDVDVFLASDLVVRPKYSKLQKLENPPSFGVGLSSETLHASVFNCCK